MKEMSASVEPQQYAKVCYRLLFVGVVLFVRTVVCYFVVGVGDGV